MDKIQQANEKTLVDFRKLSAPDKYKECIHYGNNIIFTDMNTTDGLLSFEIFEIYGGKFLFIISEQVKNCYELQ